jgi:hypothetical protein
MMVGALQWQPARPPKNCKRPYTQQATQGAQWPRATQRLVAAAWHNCAGACIMDAAPSSRCVTGVRPVQVKTPHQSTHMQLVLPDGDFHSSAQEG